METATFFVSLPRAEAVSRAITAARCMTVDTQDALSFPATLSR
jgi:hypothetical protein